jgi:4-hydroxy-2-oxoheptanedioate aldolase
MRSMTGSRVLQKLRAGEVVTCTKLNLESSRVVEIMAMAGYDCLWLDMEHVPNDWLNLEKQILAAKAHGTDVLVRVSRGSYSDHVKPLELDATGIMVPHIMGLEDARNVARMTRFHPIGRRPVDGGNADGAYCQVNFLDYLKQANEQRFVVVQIEDPEPLPELEAIAQVPGIDMLFFGPGDFSQGIGAPGQWGHPEMARTRQRVAEVCRAHGKFAGTVGSPAQAPELVAMGYQFISIGADVVHLFKGGRELLNQFQKEVSAEEESALAEAGARTLIASRDVGALEKVAEEHRALGQDVTALQLDQGSETSIVALRDEVKGRFGRLDVLVNNAALRTMKSGFKGEDAAITFAQSMQVNATGLFLLTRAMADLMAERNQGSIINIGSIMGMIGPDPEIYKGTNLSVGNPDYYFHKGGMISFTRYIGSYYGPHGIRCNCISPGGFFNNQPETFVRQYSERTFLGRMAGDTDLKGIVVFLASDASAYITGANISVDGGYTAK